MRRSIRLGCTLLAALLLTGSVVVPEAAEACPGVGLRGHWSFDGSVQDASGCANDGTVLGATPTTDWAGNPSSAYLFDGNDAIAFGDSGTLEVGLPVTISLMMQHDCPLGSACTLFENDSDDGTLYSGFGLAIATSGVLYAQWGDGGVASSNSRQSAANDVAPPPGVWHHIALVIFGEDDFRFYVNGVRSDPAAVGYGGTGGAVAYTSAPARVGLAGAVVGPYVGKLDEVRFYNRALTETEIRALDPRVGVGQPGQVCEYEQTTYLGNHPSARRNGWHAAAQGLTHGENGDDHWYITQNKPDVLWRIPLARDLDAFVTCDDPGVACARLSDIPELANPGFDHFGDPDYYSPTGDGNGYVFIPVEGFPADLPGSVAVFRTPSLEFVDVAQLQPTGNRHAPWVAFDSAGHLYMTEINSPTKNEWLDPKPIGKWTIDWPLLGATGNLSITRTGTVTLLAQTPFETACSGEEIFGDPCESPNREEDLGEIGDWVELGFPISQGGDLSGDDRLLYFANGWSDRTCRYASRVRRNDDDLVYRKSCGLHLFELSLANSPAPCSAAPGDCIARRIDRSRSGAGPFDYEYNPGLPELEEPEGLDWFDLGAPGAPTVPGRDGPQGGQLHAILLDTAVESIVNANEDEIYIKHYQVDRTCSAPPLENAASVAVWQDVLAKGNATVQEVRIFRREGTDLALEETLVAPDGLPGDGFGTSVALWDDLLAVGAPGVDQSGSLLDCGAVYVYRDLPIGWTFEEKIETVGCLGRDLGRSVAAGPDAIVAGAPKTDVGFSDIGLVISARFDGASWSTDTVLHSDGNNGDFFGSSVAMWDTHLVVGAPFKEDGGGVYAYEWNGSVWSDEQRLFKQGVPNPATVNFGRDVAVSAGWLAAAGDEASGCEPLCSGGSGLYAWDGANWSQTASFFDAELVEISGRLLASVDARQLSGQTLRLRVGTISSAGSLPVDVRQTELPFAAGKDLAVWNGATCLPSLPGICLPGTVGNDVIATIANDSVVVWEEKTPGALRKDDIVFARLSDSSIQRVDPVSGAARDVARRGFLTGIEDVIEAPDGRLLAIDAGIRALIEIDPASGLQRLRSADALIDRPRALALEVSQDVLVGDIGVDRLIRLPSTGSGSVLGPVTDPAGVAVLTSGDVIEVDRAGGRVLRIDPVTGANTVLATGLTNPWDGAIDASEQFVVATELGQRIHRVDPLAPGAAATLLSEDPLLDRPRDVDAESDGRLIVADFGAGLVRVDPTQPVGANATLLHPTSTAVGVVAIGARCGDGARRPVEECDDGNLHDADTCSASCRRQAVFDLVGVAQGGSVTLVIAGEVVTVETLLHETAAEVAGALLSAINANDALLAAGVEASQDEGRLAITGAIEQALIFDAGLGRETFVVAADTLEVQPSAAPSGRPSAVVGDLDGNGVPDLAVGDSSDGDGGPSRGAVWILFLDGDGSVLAQQKISDLSGGFTGTLDDVDLFGTSVAALGDLDGDGNEDIAVGARGDDDGGPGNGAVWILFLNADGTVDSHQKISETQGGFGGLLASDFFTASMDAIGDLDGDDVVDLVVGAPWDDDGAVQTGAVWVLFLNADGTVKAEQKISRLAGGFTGDLDAVDRFGTAVAGLGDVDGDGVEDIAVSAISDDDGGTNSGAVWLLFLQADGTVREHAKISRLSGGFGGAISGAFGQTIAGLGDVDGDGTPDLGVGGAFVILLEADGHVKDELAVDDDGAGLLIPSTSSSAIAAPGDFDGNGTPDLFVGSTLVLLAAPTPAVCGDGMLQSPVELCDDGNAISGDGCSSACLTESVVELNGMAEGGDVTLWIGGEGVYVETVVGEGVFAILDRIEDAINANETLRLRGTVASSQAGRVIVNGPVEDVVLGDVGLAVGPAPTPAPLFGFLGSSLLAGALAAAGAMFAGRRVR